MTGQHHRGRGAALAWLVVVAIGACGDDGRIPEFVPPDAETLDGGAGDAGRPSMFPDTGVGASRLLLSRAVPNHGPFGGGTEVVLRGAGFSRGAQVEIGGRRVDAPDIEVIDPNRLRIRTPAGEPGLADVVVRIGGDEAIVPDGFRYDAIALDPDRGSIAGGTAVTILGDETAFEDGARVWFGAGECAAVEVLSPTRLRCRTPPGGVGAVDVRITAADDGSEILTEDAFTYYDTADARYGGLGGGPIAGTINITVVDSYTGTPVPDAYAIVGEDFSTPHQGLTNLLGQITFSGDDLVGPLTIHVARDCFQNHSVVMMDAADVTLFVVPWLDPACGTGLPEGGGRVPRERAGISGQLVWLGPNEHGPNPWDNIPPPREDEIKVAYVHTTQSCAGSDGCRNPNEGPGGRVLETPLGDRGYPYEITSRTGAVAVYALAGLENQRTGEFFPYVTGVGRRVLVGPGETTADVHVVMDIPLDHALQVRLEGAPPPVATGPDLFHVWADIDLGGEGLFARRYDDELLDEAVRRDTEQPFRFYAQPALHGALSDARYRVFAGWYTGEYRSAPYTWVERFGVHEAVDVLIDGFLGIPVATSPTHGSPLPPDRVLRWESHGDPPDLHYIQITDDNGQPAWRHFVPGDVFEAPVPDFSVIPGVPDFPRGFLTWTVYAARTPEFDFNTMTYRQLNSSRWSASARDNFTAIR